MSTIIEYDIKINSTKAEQSIEAVGQDINGIKDSIDALTEALGKSIEQISKIGTESDALEEVEENAQNATTAVKGTGDASKTTSQSVKGIGLALKAIGIGAIIALVAKLGEAFGENDKVARLFGIAAEFVGRVLDDFISLIVDNTGPVIDFFKDVFENPLDNVRALGQAIKDNITERFRSLLDVFGFVGQGFKQLFEGDFAGAMDTAKLAAKEMVDVYTGVNDSFDKGVDLINKVVDATGDYITETGKLSVAQYDLAQSSRENAALLEGRIALLDSAAEKLRQTRDNERLSFEERQAASDALKENLAEQEQAVRSLTAANVASAAGDVAANNNEENRIALINARTDAQSKLNAVTGQVSEQQTSDASLVRTEEENELKALRDFEDRKRELQNTIDLENEETDLEKAELKIEQDFENKEIELERIIEDADQLRELLLLLETQKGIELQAVRNKFAVDEVEGEQKLKDDKLKLKADTVTALQGLATAEGGIGKALLVVKQLLNVQEAISEARKTITFSAQAAARSAIAVAEGTAKTAAVGFPQNIPLLIGYAAQAVGIFQAIKSATSKAAAISGGIIPSIGTAPSAPTASIGASRTVATPSFDNIQVESPQTQNNNIMRAYVVQGDVTDAVEADAKINTRRSL